MSESETVVELVRFTATGLETVEAATRRYAEHAKAARERTRVLADLIGSGTFGRYADQLDRAARSQERLTAAARNAVTARALASGELTRHASVMAMHGRVAEQLRTRALARRVADPALVREVARAEAEKAEQENLRGGLRNGVYAARLDSGELTRQTAAARQLNHEYDLMRQRAGNQVLAKDLASGTIARRAAETAQLRRETEELEKRARLTSLAAEHGRFGAVLRENAGQIQTLKTAALVGYGAIAGSVLGLVRAGLQGTVEGYRLEYAWTRLGRQAAGVAVPAVDKVSNTVGALAGKFERLSSSQQDTILNLGLLALAAGPVVGMARALAAVGGAAVGLGRGAAAVLGLRAAPAAGGGLAAAMRTAPGAAALAGAEAAGAVAGVAPPAGPGFLAGNPLLAGGLLLGGGALANQAGGGGLGGAVAAGGAAYGFSGGGGLRGAGRVGLPLLVGSALADSFTERYYSMLRARGENKLFAGIGTLGGGLLNTLTFGSFADRLRETGQLPGPEAGKHRDVSPLQVGLDELGGGHQRIQEEVLKVTSAAAQEQRDREVVDQLREINKKLEAQAERDIRARDMGHGFFRGGKQ